jgi:hypothetical protein
MATEYVVILVSGSPVAQGAYNASPADPAALTQAQTILRGMVLDSVASPHSLSFFLY